MIAFSFTPIKKKNLISTFPEKRCTLKPIFSLTLEFTHHDLLNPFNSSTSRTYMDSYHIHWKDKLNTRLLISAEIITELPEILGRERSFKASF
jgi:hypothetical protein